MIPIEDLAEDEEDEEDEEDKDDYDDDDEEDKIYIIMVKVILW